METKTITKTTLKNEVANSLGNKTIADSLLKSFSTLVTQDQLKVPANYALGNQVKLAYLTIIQDSNLASATPISIGQALTELVLQGLEVDKKQAYFIKYGNSLKMTRSYFGDVAVAYRTGLIQDIFAMVVYQGDEFEVDVVDHEDAVTVHHTKFENRDKPIVGAYAAAKLPNGKIRYCIMTKKEIDISWNKTKNKANTVQKEFPQEMAKRTVIRRLVKMIFNTANTTDADVATTIASYNRTTEDEYDNEAIEAEVKPRTSVHNTLGIQEQVHAEPIIDDIEEPIAAVVDEPDEIEEVEAIEDEEPITSNGKVTSDGRMF